MALSLVPRGFAVAAISAAGHGDGPLISFRLPIESVDVPVPAPGRALDLNADGEYFPERGCLVYAPGLPAGARDCFRQTAFDSFTLVRAIRAGLDLSGDGSLPISRTRISSGRVAPPLAC